MAGYWPADMHPKINKMSLDKIGIEGIKIFAHHGYYELEQKIGKEFIIDIYLVMDLNTSGASDELKDTFNYETAIKICLEEMAIPSKLIEHVAHRIASKIKTVSSDIVTVTVRISKPQPVLPITIAKFFVEITL